MQLAMLALHANGFRTLTSRPGHHQTAIQSLTLTIGFDALRKQRNLSDYSGDLVTDAAVRECMSSATALLDDVQKWLTINRPELA